MSDLSAPSSSQKITVREIAPLEVAPIRHAVLWPSVPLSAQLLPFDTLPTTHHYGAYTPSSPSSPSHPSENLIGCLTITNERYAHPSHLLPPQSEIPHYQLHKFAILPQYQGQGIGRRLLLVSVAHLRREVEEDESFLLHFDARETQIGFYEKLGFHLLSEERFVKRGPTGDGPAVSYVRMGRVFGVEEKEGKDTGRDTSTA